VGSDEESGEIAECEEKLMSFMDINSLQAGPGASPGLGGLLGRGLGAVGNFLGGLGFGGPNVNIQGLQERDQFFMDQARRGAEGRPVERIGAAQIGPTNTASRSNFAVGQEQLMRQLQEQAAGRGPSLATMQFEQGLGSGVNAQQALARSGGGNVGLAQRQAAQNVGNLTQNLAGQAAQARMAEQLSARQQLAGVLGQGRAQDFARNSFNAGQLNQGQLNQALMNQRTNEFNVNSALQGRGLDDRLSLGFGGLSAQQAFNQAQLRGQQKTIGQQLLGGLGGLLGNQFGAGGGGVSSGGFQLGAASPSFAGGPTMVPSTIGNGFMPPGFI